MNATIFKQHGGPEVLEYAEVPEPKILANEVLIEVKACALNAYSGPRYFGRRTRGRSARHLGKSRR